MSKYLQISLTDWPYFLNSSAAIRYMLSFDRKNEQHRLRKIPAGGVAR